MYVQEIQARTEWQDHIVLWEHYKIQETKLTVDQVTVTS